MEGKVVLILGGELTFKFGTSALVQHIRHRRNDVYTVSGHKDAPIDGCEHIVWDDTYPDLGKAVAQRVDLSRVGHIVDTWVGEPIEWHPGTQYTMSRYQHVLQLLAGAGCGCILQIPVHTRALHCAFLVCSGRMQPDQVDVSRGHLQGADAGALQQDLALLVDHSPMGAWGEDQCGELQSCIEELAQEGLFVNFQNRKFA